MGLQLGFYDTLLVMLVYGNAMRWQIFEDGIKWVYGIVLLQQNRWASLSLSVSTLCCSLHAIGCSLLLGVS
jgi:hypothetical protein